MNGNLRKNIFVGQLVEIVRKQDQRTGQTTEGIVRRILTNSSSHPHGIKVMLDSREVGRVKRILEEEED